MRRSRLPPPSLLAAMLAGAVLLSAAWPEKHVLGCCAVKSAYRTRTAWRVEVQAPGSVASNRSLVTNHSDLNIAIRTCCAAGYCSPAAVPCRPLFRTVEDPSDALWLRTYDSGGEMLVLVRAGLLALIVLIVAILVDGALARPRRERIAYAPLAALVLLSLSALLQLCLIPRRWQPSLAGAGILQSILWIAMVIVGAFMLPGAALALQSIAVANAQIAMLTVRALFWCVTGCVAFALLAGRFYARNLWLQLRIFYSNNNVHSDVDYAQDVYMEQLNISYDFLGGISDNPLLKQVNESINDSAKSVLRATLGPGNSAREFSGLDDPDEGDTIDDDILRMPPGSTHPIPQRDGQERRVRTQEDTPLLYGSGLTEGVP